LRYPGGKSSISNYFIAILKANKVNSSGFYCEPFAGGAGVALTLLLTGCIGSIYINDRDPCIAAFWQSLLDAPSKFIDEIERCDISMDNWFYYRKIYDKANLTKENLTKKSRFELGFATFFLNRCNRGGILPHAGPIGGRNQSGQYKLNLRFKKDVLIQRILLIENKCYQITFTDYDALYFLKWIEKSSLPPINTFLYLDPPYYQRGKELYLNYYNHNDHFTLAKTLKTFNFCKWFMTYDDCVQVRELYSEPKINIRELVLQYSIQKVRKTNEILIAPKSTKMPLYEGYHRV
jgi:DNA adenine methylase